MGGIHPFEEQRRHVELLKFRSIFCSTTLAFLGGKLRKESAWNKGIADTVHCCWFRNPERSSWSGESELPFLRFKYSINHWMWPYQRTPKEVARAIRYSGWGVVQWVLLEISWKCKYISTGCILFLAAVVFESVPFIKKRAWFWDLLLIWCASENHPHFVEFKPTMYIFLVL